MSDGAWIFAATLAGIAVGGFAGWHLRGADMSLDRTIADAGTEALDVRTRLLHLLGATPRDFADLDRGVLVPDVADRIRARSSRRGAS
jgi:hypothetical protein